MCICLCTKQRSTGTDQYTAVRLSRGAPLTVQVRHRRVVLVLDEHVAELELRAVEVLAHEHEPRRVPALREAAREDVAHLRRQPRRQGREVQLRGRLACTISTLEGRGTHDVGVELHDVVHVEQVLEQLRRHAPADPEDRQVLIVCLSSMSGSPR